MEDLTYRRTEKNLREGAALLSSVQISNPPPGIVDKQYWKNTIGHLETLAVQHGNLSPQQHTFLSTVLHQQFPNSELSKGV